MKLLYSAGSCSTSCHISLEESGLKYEAVEVDWDNPSDPNIAQVEKLNPMGTLPILITDEGKVLNQNAAIHTYIADKASGRNLLPPVGTVERAEAINWLGFVNSDLHKAFGPMFALSSTFKEPAVNSVVKNWSLANVNQCLGLMDQSLAGKDYLTGKTFTVADAYAFVVVGWTKWLQIPTEQYRNVNAYLGRIYQRPAVQKVLKEEGLLE
jgi:glutathione S-transferase